MSRRFSPFDFTTGMAVASLVFSLFDPLGLVMSVVGVVLMMCVGAYEDVRDARAGRR